MAAGKPAKENEEIVFLVEVLGVRGLTKPERTSLQLTGFGIEGTFNSLPLADESTEPSGWLFLPSGAKEEVKEEEPTPKAVKGKAAAAPKGKDKTPPATAEVEPAPPAHPPQPHARLPQPCGTIVQRHRLLDVVCGSPLKIDVMRQADPQISIGRATVHLQDLIHNVATVEADAELVWSPAFLEEWTAAQEAAEAEAAAAAAAAAGSDAPSATPTGGADKSTPRSSPGGRGSADPDRALSPRAAASPRAAPAKPPFAEMRVRIATAGPIGRVLCPEDLEDWAALTVNIHGCYSLPPGLVEVAGPLPPETFGVLQDHPLSYSIRFLGCKFDNGNLVLPEVPPDALPPDGTAADPAAPDDPGEPAAGESAAADGNFVRGSPSGAASLFAGTIGKEEFVEGLVRAGFRMAHDCAAEVFDFVDVTAAGVIGREDFVGLGDVGVPAEAPALVALCELLVQKSGQLDEAFSALDDRGDGCLTMNTFTSSLETAGYTGTPEEIESLFVALDTERAGTVVREGLKILGLHRRIEELRKVEKVKQFLFESCDSADQLTKQLDESKSGSIEASSWKAALQRLAYPDAEGPDIQLAFDFLDSDRRGCIEYSALQVLEKFDVGALTRVLPQVQEFLMGTDGDAGTVMASLSDVCNVEDDEMVSATEFAKGCKALGYTLKVDPHILFAFLDEGGLGRLGVMEFTELIFFNASEKLRRLASCKTFMEDTFGSLEIGFGKLFDDHSEFFKLAEDKLPRIEFPEASLCVYRGRAWLQQVLNTLNDPRGRRLASKTSIGGSWLYFYPVQKGNAQPVDFKDVADPAQSTQARIARWHHAQGFVDLRRLSAPVPTDTGPEVEFQAFLSQVAAQPKDINAAGDLAKAPFTCRMYVKGSLRLDRPLVRLCPRDILPLPQTESGEPLVPPPPDKAPPPSASEELEMEAHRAVTKLVAEFKKMCHEQDLKETRIANRAGEDFAVLLGHGVQKGSFLAWLEQQDSGGVYRDLSMDLRRAVVRFVLKQHKDAPSCGLTGDEKDAMYTGIRTILLKHFMRSLNNDINKQQQRRDGRLWKNPPVLGDTAVEQSTSGKSQAETAAQQAAQDSALRRLAFEYELCGNVSRAGKLFDERLALPCNAENPSPWYDYARFLMRCGQRQPEAEKALRFAISLRPADSGPTIEEVAFLACIMQNYQLPCSLSSSGQSPARFEAAISLLSTYADQHPLERVPLFLIFIIYALEAWAAQAEAEAASAARAGMGMSDQNSTRHLELKAMAAKYLELARVPQEVFDGTLGNYSTDGLPTFPELEGLVRYERVNRKEIAEPTPAPAPPEAWQPAAFPALMTYEDIHSVEDSQDNPALSCIDLMLHFGVPSFVRFLVTEAPALYGFLSPATARSERCQMQLVKALMLQSRWADAVDLIEQQFQRTDRIRAAHQLLGECHYHLSLEAVASPATSSSMAKACFEKTLSFLPDPSANTDQKVQTGDAIVHFRIANMHYAAAKASTFTEMEPMEAAMEHYKQALLIAQTAEVWWRIGVCAYRIACFGRVRSLFRCKEPALMNEPEDAEQAQKRQVSIREASRYLVEANLLDVSRPQINAWLAICAVEMGQTQVAKQAVRQLLRYEEQLDADTALELAQVLLRFSDESRARQNERKRLVQDGRYASEAIAVAKILLTMRDSGHVHYMLGLAYVILGDDATALPEFQAAHPCFGSEPPCQDEIAAAMRACAARLNGGASAEIGPVSVPEPPQRSESQEMEFKERLESTRQGGNPAGLADFANFATGFEVYDHDLPEILEASLEGQVEKLLLSGTRLGTWGLREVVARLRESPSLLNEVDMSNCACVGQVGKELVNSFPYSRGCSLETAGCGLPEDDVVRLRNRTKEAGQVLRRNVAEHKRSREMCDAYNMKQDVLQQVGMEEGTSEPPPPPPLPAHHPDRWRDGLDTRARIAYHEYKAVNAAVGGDLYTYRDDREVGPVIEPFAVVRKTGESQMLDQDTLTILDGKRNEMLEQAGFGAEFDEEEGEYDMGERERSQVRRGPELPDSYRENFGERGRDNNLIGFMVWNGVRALPEELRALQRRRAEYEAEQKRRNDEYEASQAELRRRREEMERAQARLREEMEAEEGRKVEEWEAAYRIAAQAKNNLTTKAGMLYDNVKMPMGLASGQLIAHFTYLCRGPDLFGDEEPEPLSRFSLKHLSETPRPKPRRGHDLHEALLSGKIILQEATGKSYGQDALTVTLQSAASEPLEVTVRRGTIFQHVDWVHRQNLLVAFDYLLALPAGGIATKQMMAFCMNLSCACSAGDPMQLTEFYVDDNIILNSQASVWDHFERSFGHRP